MTTTEWPPGSWGTGVDVSWSGGAHTANAAAQTDDELAAELQQRLRARDTAREARLILQLAARRSTELDPPPDAPGAHRPGWTRAAVSAEVSEFLPAELCMLLNLGRGTAAHRLGRALTWSEKLPATLAALESGHLDERRADARADVLQHTTPDVAGRVEDALLPGASDLPVVRLRKRASELMLALDAAAAEERRVQAGKAADVHLYRSPTDGRVILAVDLSADEGAGCQRGDRLPREAARGRRGHPADRAAGLAITAAHLRELLVRVSALGLTAPEGGSLTFAVTGPDGELLATVTPAELDRLVRRGCPDHPDTDCACTVLGASPVTDAYAPTAEQRAFVTTRDHRCRSSTAASASAGPTWTTCEPTPTAARRPAPTCAACAAATTGSRPSPPAGASP